MSKKSMKKKTNKGINKKVINGKVSKKENKESVQDVQQTDMQDYNIRAAQVFLLASPFLCGGFYEGVSCLFSVILTGYLLYLLKKSGVIIIKINLTWISMLLLVIAYGVSVIWAVDHGMAVLGFVKFLPLLLFLTIIMQIQGGREALLDMVPLAGGFMTVLSSVLGQIPLWRDYFWVNKRLAGFFQYPNAFALYLIAGTVILAGKDVWNRRQIINIIVLLSGIVLTGSRTSFFILLAVLAGYTVFHKNSGLRKVLLLLMAGLAALTGLYVMLTGNVSNVGRYMTSFTNTSTFLGRLLYFKDALPVILRHPLGLGYMGYYYLQGSFQTGVYSVLHIHNELLQVFLDVGWIPAVLLAAAAVKSFLAKQTGLTRRMLLFAVSVHCMFDFDLQFIVIGFVLLLAMDTESGDERRIASKVWIPAAAGILMGVSCWFGIVSGFYRWGEYETAAALYPGCTDAWLKMLPRAKDEDEMERLADNILELNQSASLAYSAKARLAYAEGDFESMIEYKQKAIALARYELEEYLDYFDMLYVGVQLYEQAGDEESAEFCRQKLLEIPDMMEEVLDETDELAYKIKDKPDLALPEEYQEMLLFMEL